MKALLQGRFFGHPLHTWLVHFPFGFWSISLVLDCYTRFREPSATVVEASYYALAAGTLLALFAAITGLADYTSIRRDHPAKRLATWHMFLNIITILLYLLNTYARAGYVDEMRTPIPLFLLSLAGFGIISLSGFLGGMLVYHHGVGVGRHRQNSRTPNRTIHLNTSEPAAQRGQEDCLDYYFVAKTDHLADQQFLRVAVGGYVVLIAKIGDEYFGVQDFCTHRSAPLSEGCLRDHELQCPWHNSRFDLRTGAVTQGPAKVNLKTFRVRVQKNEVQLGLSRPG